MNKYFVTEIALEDKKLKHVGKRYECDSLLEARVKDIILSLTNDYKNYAIYETKGDVEQVITFNNAEYRRYEWLEWDSIIQAVSIIDMKTGKKYIGTMKGILQEV